MQYLTCQSDIRHKESVSPPQYHAHLFFMYEAKLGCMQSQAQALNRPRHNLDQSRTPAPASVTASPEQEAVPLTLGQAAQPRPSLTSGSHAWGTVAHAPDTT
eukprot:CAMPEP_0174383698 /NCGR_PEP_ID=MMETSP0811_2-20130205/125419_1 /TAXON_ID=73025 ORGANISM="Eutreptiella gymnastica-like, Strain CCMP1594" /NCGR_SAMPLE_ID=MMETSP0811_2 /ASSEMBLY_ACC=CAM_ASM_000667 /LENGTH=101 /DNA_ID=CAMNT_0015537391 /DNA_START=139 /DNA_END=445 /DNA_ORIENTATION=-